MDEKQGDRGVFERTCKNAVFSCSFHSFSYDCLSDALDWSKVYYYTESTREQAIPTIR